MEGKAHAVGVLSDPLYDGPSLLVRAHLQPSGPELLLGTYPRAQCDVPDPHKAIAVPTNPKHLLWPTLQMKFLFGEPSIKKDLPALPPDSASAELFLARCGFCGPPEEDSSLERGVCLPFFQSLSHGCNFNNSFITHGHFPLPVPLHKCILFSPRHGPLPTLGSPPLYPLIWLVMLCPSRDAVTTHE